MLDGDTLWRTHPLLTTTDTKRDMLLRSVLGCFCRQKVVENEGTGKTSQRHETSQTERNGHRKVSGSGEAEKVGYRAVRSTDVCSQSEFGFLKKMEFEVVSSGWIRFVRHGKNA